MSQSPEIGQADPDDRPTRKKQERSTVTQTRLLEAASSAFAESGFKGTSTRDIADRAGVHHPLITYHFKNKKLLWRAAVDKLFESFNRKVDAVVETASPSEARALAMNLIRTFVDFAHANPELFRIISHESSQPGPRLDWIVDTHLKPAFERWSAFLRELQAAGIAREGDPALLLNMLRATASMLPAMAIEIEKSSGFDLSEAAAREQLSNAIIACFLVEPKEA